MDHTKMTITAYDKNVQTYAEKFMCFKPYQQQVDAFIELLPMDAQVLDLGCGPGNTARQLLASGKIRSLIGVDLSTEMVLTARKNAPNGEFLVQDLRDTDFPARAFDVVVMSFCIVHLIDIEAAALISRMERWLKPGGMLYLSFMEGKQPGLENTSFSDSPIFFNYYDGNVIMTLLQQHGLSITRISRTGYAETDGSITTDVFIFATKPVMS